MYHSQIFTGAPHRWQYSVGSDLSGGFFARCEGSKTPAFKGERMFDTEQEAKKACEADAHQRLSLVEC